MDKRKTHIITASDENYVPGVLVLIASAHRHNPQARFTLLANGLGTDSKNRVWELARRLGCGVQIIEIDERRLQSLAVRRRHLTKATYARLFIPELLNENGRVIYMDCDMLVTGPLDDAWNVPLENHHVLAAVPCPAPSKSALAQLGIVAGDYFNAGFLVFDLETWRQHQIAEACLAKLTSETVYLSEDESVLNDLFRGKYFKLPSGYNFYAFDSTYQDALNGTEGIRNIHFVVSPKPWNYPTPFSALWYYEAGKISDLVAIREQPLTLRQKISKWNGRRKQWMGRLARRRKYRDRAAIRTFLNDTVIPAYITTGSMAKIPPPSPPFSKPE